MKTLGKRFYQLSTLGLIACTAWTTGYSSIAMGQQGVAPPASGYGNRNAPPNNQQPSGQPNAGPQAGRPNQAPMGGIPNAGAPIGNAANPALNPAFNQRPVANQQPNGGAGNQVVTKDPYAANPLTPQEIANMDQILNFWERSTADIERYSSNFTRWQHNSSDNFVGELAKKTGKDVRSVAVSISSGELKYMSPDKGMFKIGRLVKLSGQLDASNKIEYKEFANLFGEWWLCDGEKVYEYDRSAKKCTRFVMPPEMKGSGILESPMPFMFGVKAEKVKARYWLRQLPPPMDQQGKPQDVYVIEAYPKFQADAVNYDHVQVYLDKFDRDTLMPVMLVKYNTEHVDEQGKVLNDNREIFEFKDRAKNATVLQKISDAVLRKEFIPLDVDKDWTVEERTFDPPATENVRAANNPALPQQNSAPVMRK